MKNKNNEHFFEKVLTKKKCSYIIISQANKNSFKGDDYMKMKIKIINKKKFISSLIIMVGVLLALFLGLNNTYSKTEISYKEEFIYAGDTLWSIAEREEKGNKYYENKDIRSIVSELKDINHIDGNLKIGEKILIPTFNY